MKLKATCKWHAMQILHLGGAAPTVGEATATFDIGGILPATGVGVRFAIKASFLRSAANRPRMLDTTVIAVRSRYTHI